MKKLISHRGNTNGRYPLKENYPEYAQEAIRRGFDVVVDVWFYDGQFYLGSEMPQYRIDSDFLRNSKVWCHARNQETLSKISKDRSIHSFMIKENKDTKTSKGYILSHNGSDAPDTVAFRPEVHNLNPSQHSAICSDFIDHYRIKESTTLFDE